MRLITYGSLWSNSENLSWTVKERKGKANLTNLEAKIVDDKLIITVDLKQRHGTSKSGKNAIIASTQGNVTLPGREEVVMGINIYTKAESK